MSSTLSQRLASALPPGLVRLGLGTAVLGVASYVHLAVAGHELSAGDKSAVSVLWALAFSVGYSIAMPLEQEIGRIVAGEAAGGRGTREIVRRGTLTGGALLAILGVLIAAFSVPLAHSLFNGQVSMVAALGGAFVGLAVTAVYRGALAGHGEFGAYSTLMSIDGGLRIVLALAFAAAGVRSVLWYSLILTIAPLVAAAVATPTVRRVLTVGGSVAWSALHRGLALLIVSMLLSQVVLNIAVINVKLLAPTEVTLVSALLAALVLARVPLFVFGALQSVLLPSLAAAYAAGDREAFGRLIRKSTAIVVVLGIGGGIGCVVLGPLSVRALFGMTDELGPVDFAWLALGSLCYMQAMVLGQALTVQDRHRVQALAWLAGVATLAAVTFGPGGVTVRVEIAYAAGSAVTAVTMVALLRLGRSRVAPGLPENEEAERQTYSKLAAHVSGSGWVHGES
jgi:O-antigen/teichoic acid export membrane protein